MNIHERPTPRLILKDSDWRERILLSPSPEEKLCRPNPRDGQPDLEASISGLGLDLDRAAMLPHDTLHGVKAEPRALADTLRGEEWLEDMRQNFRRNARTIVGDLNHNAVVIARSAHA